METWDGSGNTTTQDTDEARLERHLRAIFLGPCYCVKDGCQDCADAEEFHGVACDVHNDTCQACIAEHALYCDGDHPATKR